MSIYQVTVGDTKDGIPFGRVSYFDYTTQKENQIYVCSRYHPLEEAIVWAKSVYKKDKDVFLVYGLGLGYHILALERLLNRAQHIIVIEMNKEVYSQLEQYIERTLVEGSRKQIQVRLIDTVQALKECIREAQEKRIDFSIYKPMLKLIPPALHQVYEVFERWSLKPSKEGIYKEAITKNYLYFQNKEYPVISEWFNKIQQPIVIVSAGPSLSKNVDWLARYRSQVFILATGRVLRMLLQRGIRPDMFCIIDALKAGTYVQIGRAHV